MSLPFRPEPPEQHRLRRLICHKWFPTGCILAALVIAALNQWALS